MKVSRQNSKSMVLERQKSRISEHQGQDKNISYLDLNIDDGDIDINETIKEKQTLRRLRSQKQLNSSAIKNGQFAAEEAKDQNFEPEDQWKKGFMDGFRNYIGMKKSQRNLSLGDLDLIKEFNSHSKKNKDQLLAQQLLGSSYSEQVGEDTDSASAGGSSNKIELNKRRQQTAKILAEMNKKLRISQKSKQDKFDDSMQVFKKTETYIEIRPFLEKMNIHNSNNYLVQVNDIEKSIAQAKQKQSYNKMAHQEEMERSLSTFEQLGTPRDLNEKDIQQIQLQQAKSAQSLIQKANEALINSNTKHTFRSLHNSIMSKLIDELGLAPDDSYSMSRSKIPLEKQIKQMETNQQSGQHNNNASQSSQRLSSQTTHPTKVNKFSQERDGRDLASDENQFFENLGRYLGKAQMDINYKEEVAAELSAFQEAIEAGQKKLEELRQKQFKGFIGSDGKMMEAFESGKNLTTEQYHQQFREKALQARLALNKVNKALFQKKWANSQMKRKMERQRERNELFSKLGISPNGESTQNHSTDDLINPSRRMNLRILAAKHQHEQMHILSEQQQSTITVTSGIPTIEEEDDQINEQNATPREDRMIIPGSVQRKSNFSGYQQSAHRGSASKSIYQQQQIRSLLQIDNINNGSGNQQQFATNETVVSQNPQSYPSITTNNMNSNAELSSVDNGIPGFQVNTKKRDSYNFQEDGLSQEFLQDDYGTGGYMTQPYHQVSIKDDEDTKNNNTQIQKAHEKNESNTANVTHTASSSINTKLPIVSHSRSSSNYSILPSTTFHSKKNSMPKLPSALVNIQTKLPQINTSNNNSQISNSISSNRQSGQLYQLQQPEKRKLSMLNSPSRLSMSNSSSINHGNMDGSRMELTKNEETNKSMFALTKQKDSFQYHKLDKIINDIDSEHTEYVAEKTKIKDKLQLICETVDKDMRKYEQQQYVESIRDVDTDISLKNYHSGSRASILSKFPRNKINI